MLHPDIAALLPAFQGKVSWSEIPLASLRKSLLRNMAALDMAKIELAAIENSTVSNEGYEIPVRVYRPSLAQALPIVVYLHGGGWVTFNVDSHDSFCRYLALHSESIVVAVDYRLAPEHKFPAALEDVLAVLAWLPQQAKQWQADSQNIAIAGDSAGANLATVACYLTQGQAIQPKLQCLIYPVVDTTQERESFSLFAEGYMLERQHMLFFINHYLNHADERQDVRVSPLLMTDKGHQPPALVFTAGFDPLRDEGLAYAQSLEQAGVSVEYHCFDDLIHGFLQLGKIPVAAQAIDMIAKKLAGSWCRLS